MWQIICWLMDASKERLTSLKKNKLNSLFKIQGAWQFAECLKNSGRFNNNINTQALKI